MIQNILNWIVGYRRVTVAAPNGIYAINLLREKACRHWGLHTDQEGNVSFFLLEKDAQYFTTHCTAQNMPWSAEDPRGLPHYRRKIAGRWGIPVGTLLFFLIVQGTSGVVWSMEISGNRTFSDQQITEMLYSSGFGEGTLYRNMDFELFQNDFPLQHPGISWIAVNMLGNRAFVEIRESTATVPEPTGNAANIVAAEDGQIVEMRISSGRAQVVPLQVVRQGDLLISGIMTIREAELRMERASGQILARVNRTIQVEVPLLQQEKEYTGMEKEEKFLIFFGKNIKFFQKGGFEGGSYDTIIENVPVVLPGGIRLPLRLSAVTAREYRMKSVLLTEEQAYTLAEQKFGKAVSSLLESAELLSMDTETVMKDGVCCITGKAVCLADIAQSREIVSPTP